LSAAAPDLHDRLAELEMEHATLLSELRAFEADYLRVVGVIDVQVQELEARILARSGDRVAAAAAERRYRETTTALRTIPVAGPPVTDDLKGLFRDAAKRMHPDLQRDAAGRGHAEAFMKRLNQAYSSGDAEGIAGLVRQWETSPYATGAPSSTSPALAAAVAQAQQRLDEARETEFAQLMERAFLASMQGQDLLAELRAAAEIALADARDRLAALDM
jgi:hypothetical protein